MNEVQATDDMSGIDVSIFSRAPAPTRRAAFGMPPSSPNLRSSVYGVPSSPITPARPRQPSTFNFQPSTLLDVPKRFKPLAHLFLVFLCVGLSCGTGNVAQLFE